MFHLISISHYMRDRFPGGNGSKPWLGNVIGTHATRDEAERQLNRIRLAYNGVLPSHRTYSIVPAKSR